MAAGTGPDIFATTNLIEENKLGFISPMPVALANDISKGYLDGTDSILKIGGRYYGVFREYNTFGIMASARVFDEAGMGSSQNDLKKTISTWDDLINVSRKLTRVEPDGKTSRYGIPIREGTFWGGIVPFYPILAGFGGDFLSDDGSKVTLNSEAGHAALGVISALGQAERNAAPPLANFYKGMAEGKIAMTYAALWGPPLMVSDYKTSYDDIRLLPYPKVVGANRNHAVTQPWMFAVNGASPNAEEAWKFLTWISTGDRVVRRYRQVGYFLSRAELRDYVMRRVDPTDPMLPFLAENLAWMPGSEVPDLLTKHGIAIDHKVLNDTSKAVYDVFYNRTSIPEALTKANAAFVNLLAEMHK
jgi:ABC-type glycerol-3-phosphate transport system substrate-binding protein